MQNGLGLLNGKIALITGASKGIGRAIAIRLAQLGSDIIYINYNNSEKKARKVVEEIERLGKKAYLVKADISKAEEVDRMFKFIRETTEHLDILINNAGVTSLKFLRAMKENDWDDVIDVDLKGTYLCSKQSLRLLHRGGRIVNISSIAAIKVGVCQAHYCAAKGGLIALSKAMAKELGPLGINVNVVAPGPTITDMNAEFGSKDDITKSIPLKRVAVPDDIANAVVYFCLPISEYVTGQVLYVDGGLSL